MSKSKCIIFVHESIRDVDRVFMCRGAEEKGLLMKKLFEEEFDFKDIEIITDMPKTEIIEKFEKIRLNTVQHEKEEAAKREEIR